MSGVNVTRKTAIIDATDLGNIKHYTYADLSRAADTLVHHLKGLGIVQGIGSVCCAVRTCGPPPPISRFGNWGPFRSRCSNCSGQKPCHHAYWMQAQMRDCGSRGAFRVDRIERDAGPARGAEVIRSTIHCAQYIRGNTRRFNIYLWHHGKSKGALHAHRV